MIGTSTPCMARRSTIRGTAAADSGLLTVIRTSSEPARHSAAICFAVDATSAVPVLVIDCTTTGASPPTATPPMRTWRVDRRGSGPNADASGSAWQGGNGCGWADMAAFYPRTGDARPHDLVPTERPA